MNNDVNKLGNFPLDKDEPIIALVNVSKFDGQWIRIGFNDDRHDGERLVDIPPGSYARFNAKDVTKVEPTPCNPYTKDESPGPEHTVNGSPAHVRLNVGFARNH